MGVYLTLRCGGCDETAEATGPLRRRFHSIGGGALGTWQLDDPTTLAPDGWVMFDPYTQCTYCPACWDRIESGPTDDQLNNRYGVEGGIPYDTRGDMRDEHDPSL